MTSKEARLIESNRLIYSLPASPHAIYEEAIRRTTNLSERMVGQPKAKQAKMLAEYNDVVKVVRAFYANHEGVRGGHAP